MKKNLDDLFNDKFKHAEITPPEEIWDRISSQLPFEKQNKKIIPIWYLLAGTAAAIAIIALIFTENPSPTSNQKITNSTEKSINNDERTESSKFKQPDAESLFEPKNNIVRSKIQNPVLEKSEGNQNFHTTDKESQIIKDTKNNPNNSYTLTESSNNEVESRTVQSLNSDYKLSQLSQNDVAIVANDSIKLQEDNIADVENIEDLIDKKEVVESLKTSKSKRLSVTTTAGALYFDGLSGGSPIEEAFTNNDVSNEITTSFGINFGYQISQKIKIRTGISQIKSVSNTKNISYYSILNSPVIEGSEVASSPSDENAASVFGNLNQSIGFIEVPSEIEYSIINKKFGINLIGGFSTLFLNKNKISLSTENSNFDFGKAKNLNEISFTANAGLGLSYKISPQFHFKLEPVFKYQLNTFKNIRNFNPYYFGLYSGFSFHF